MKVIAGLLDTGIPSWNLWQGLRSSGPAGPQAKIMYALIKTSAFSENFRFCMADGYRLCFSWHDIV